MLKDVTGPIAKLNRLVHMIWLSEFRFTNGSVIRQLNPIRRAEIWIPIRRILTQACQQESNHES